MSSFQFDTLLGVFFFVMPIIMFAVVYLFCELAEKTFKKGGDKKCSRK